jgi:hypothetical protein
MMLRALKQQLPSWWAAAERRQAWLVPAVLGGSALVLLLALVLPGSTYSGNYTNDLMIFLDGAYRFRSGQVPNVDFHTPLGALTILLPAFGHWMGGFGGMMPWATAAFTAIYLPLLIYVCRSRLPLPYALGFGLFALLLVIRPLNIGEQVDDVSFAMFYNRFGYGLLSLLFLLALPRAGGKERPFIDAAVAAALLVLMFYLKISYFAIGAAFLIGLLLLAKPRVMGMTALAAAAGAMFAIHFFWGGTGTYLADIRTAAEASGAVRGSLFTLSRIVLLNFMEVMILLAVLGMALSRGVGWRMLLLCLYMLGAGVLLVNQNAQMMGIVTTVPAAIVAALAPGGGEDRSRWSWPRAASALLIAVLVIPAVAVSIVTIGYFFGRSARAPSGSPYEARFAGVIAQEGMMDVFKVGPEVQRIAYRTERPTLEMYRRIRNQRFKQVLSQSEYLRTLDDGLRLLQQNPRLAGKVFVFDMGNPFNALLGRVPPVGVDAWNHKGRTISEERYRPAEVMFADVDVVMVPKAPSELSTTQLLTEIYGPYLRQHYRHAGKSDYWDAYSRRAGRDRTAR